MTSAAPLDPNAFTSVGTFAASAGTYTADLNGTPTLTVGGATYTGAVVSQGAGKPEIAVFAFDDVIVNDGVTITANASTRAMAILSKNDIRFFGSGTINVANGVAAGALGGGGNFGSASNGHGPGGGRDTNTAGGGGGGGFGGVGGHGSTSYPEAGVGGAAYGDLAAALEAGSGGGTGSIVFVGYAAGGSGGGGLELGAVRNLSLAATTVIDASGGNGAATGSVRGGGGSGGGLIVHAGGDFSAPTGASLLVGGGNGGIPNGAGGGGGAGGRILYDVGSYTLSATPTHDISGGPGGSGAEPGAIGNVQVRTDTISVGAGVVYDFSKPDGYDAFNTPDNVRVLPGGFAFHAGAYANPGVVTVNGTGVFTATGVLSGGDWTLGGGSLVAPQGLAVDATHALAGVGTVQGRINIAGTLHARGGATLTVGDANRTLGVVVTGPTVVGEAGSTQTSTLLLLDADRAAIANTTLHEKAVLSAPNGIALATGASLNASANTRIDGAFTNNGTVSGPAGAGQFLTFTDDVDGAGSYTGGVRFSDGFSPGNSPAKVSLGTAAFDATTSLTLELGGTTPGAGGHDQLLVGTSLALAGSLEVVTINGFDPSLGDAFVLIADDPNVLGTGALTGAFANVNLPALAPGFAWETVGTSDAFTITVVPEPAAATALSAVAVIASLRRRRREVQGA